MEQGSYPDWVRLPAELVLRVLVFLLVAAGCGSAPPPASSSTAPAAMPSPAPSGGAAQVDLPLAATGDVCSGRVVTPASVRVGTVWVGLVRGCPAPQTFRGFLAFATWPVPEGARVVSAVLTGARSQTGVPYAVTNQRLLAETVAWYEDGSLSPREFDAPALEGSRAVVAAAATGDLLEVDVTDLVRRCLESGLAYAAFRFRFALEPVPPGTLDNLERLSPPFRLRVTYRL